uniref:NEAT domain-containing protein n=1 Tax=Ndongobacter massiliensis TaxID=1871025 RepID=UPI000930AA6F|nr:NEAT domain-containing protein [Ndongobacter massiliensis]
MRKKWVALLMAFTLVLGIFAPATPSFAEGETPDAADELTQAVEELQELPSVLNEEAEKIRDAAGEYATKLLDADVYRPFQLRMMAQVLRELKTALGSDPYPQDGTYEIDGLLHHAYQDSASMGNNAIVKPMHITVKDQQVRAGLNFIPLKFWGMEGYLSLLYYLPEWETEMGPSPAGTDTPIVLADVDEYYVGLRDALNDPNSKDCIEKIKDQDYPKWISFPMTWGDPEVWVRVFVPIMERIGLNGGTEGMGTQFAKLQFDWSTLKQIETPELHWDNFNQYFSDMKRIADNDIDNGNTPQDTINAQRDFALAMHNYGTKLLDEKRVNQDVIDAMAEACRLFTEFVTPIDFSALEKAVNDAKAALNNTEQYTHSSLEALRPLMEAGEKICKGEEIVTQERLEEATQKLRQALRALTEKAQPMATDKPAQPYVLKKSTGGLKFVFTPALDDFVAAYLDKQEDSAKLPDTAYTLASGSTVLTLQDAYLNTLKEGTHKLLVDFRAGDETKAGLVEVAFTIEKEKAEKEKAQPMVADKPAQPYVLKKSTGGLKFVFTPAMEDCLAAYLEKKEDSAKLPDTAYTLASGSTVLTLQDAYLNTLKEGTHKLLVDFRAGDETKAGLVEVAFTIEKAPAEPKPGEDPSKPLDYKKLSDGTYYLPGKMVKTNKKDPSMSNGAIDHDIKLTVKDGQYFLSMKFKSLHFAGKIGNLGTLKYFKTGYTEDRYGVPQGATGEVSIDEYMRDGKGNRLVDDFGTDYPEQVTYPMLAEALENDGWVPLQVFVPVMESIAQGLGTQPVYLKLDWTQIRKAEEKLPDNPQPDDPEKPGGKQPGSVTQEKKPGTLPQKPNGNTKRPSNGNLNNGKKPTPKTGDVGIVASVILIASATAGLYVSRKGRKDPNVEQ